MKKLLLLLCGLCAATGAFAAPDSLAINTFTMHGDVRERGMIGLKLDNGQSAVFNLTANCNTAQCAHGMAGIRLDQNGHMLHYKKFGHISIDVDPIKAIWTADKHILLVGLYGDERILMKVDTMFNVVWARRVEKRQSQSSILENDLREVNGSYYLSFDNTLVKISPDGTIVFSKIYGPEMGTTDDFKYIYLNTLTPMPGGKFFMGGGIDVGPDPWDGEVGFMMIIDTNGTILKQKKFTIGAPYGEEITFAFKQTDNKLRVFGRYDNDIYTAEVDTNLAMTNVKTFVGENAFTHTVNYNGVDAYTLAFSYNGMSVVSLDNNGTVQWSRSYGGGFSPYSIYNLSNCTYGLYGSCNTSVSNWKKGYWIKINSDGQSSAAQLETAFTTTTMNLTATLSASSAVDSGNWQTNFDIQDFLNDGTSVGDSLWSRTSNPLVCPETPQHVAIEILKDQRDLCSPNPFYGQMEIGKDWDMKKIEYLVVYDITGKVILNEVHPTERTIRFAESVKGMVFVRWMYEGQVYTQKMTGL